MSWFFHHWSYNYEDQIDTNSPVVPSTLIFWRIMRFCSQKTHCYLWHFFSFFFRSNFAPQPHNSKWSILHYRSNLRRASNDLKFSINIVQRIIRPMVKKSTQLNHRFKSYKGFSVFLGRFPEKGPKKDKNPRNFWTGVLIELIFSLLVL